MQIELRTGPQINADGSTPPPRGDKEGGTTVTPLHGASAEAARRQGIYTAYLLQGTTTVAAGNIVGAAAAASTQFAVWNPTGSGRLGLLHKLKIQFFSGTPTAGGLTLSVFNAASVAASIANYVPKNHYINGPSGSLLCLASAAGSALTGGLALSTLMNLGWSSSATAIASPAGIWFTEDFAGEVVVPPGFGVVPTFSGAGTTLLVGYSLSWEEVLA